MTGTLGREVISTRQRKIAELARREPKLTLGVTCGAFWTDGCETDVPLSSKAIVRGAGCPSWARPELWEPRVGNCPRPPGIRRMFARWRQENFFRYMRQEYNLDHLCTYATEAADPQRPVPNPQRNKRAKELAALNRERARLEKAYMRNAERYARVSARAVLSALSEHVRSLVRIPGSFRPDSRGTETKLPSAQRLWYSRHLARCTGDCSSRRCAPLDQHAAVESLPQIRARIGGREGSIQGGLDLFRGMVWTVPTVADTNGCRR